MNNLRQFCLLVLLLFPTILLAQTSVSTKEQLISNLAKRYDVCLTADIDLSGEQSISVMSKLDLCGYTIHYKELPKTGEVFLFYLYGSILNGTISGPNGNVMAEGGTFGAVRVYDRGVISGVNFINCDKFGVYNFGKRYSNTDTLFITNCTFSGIKRLGYGYSVWTQYGYSVIRNSTFENGRHGVDGSSEGNQYDIRYCTFLPSFYNYQIHLHEYNSGKSGAGMIFKHNYVFGKYAPVDIWPPFTGVTDIDSNFFEPPGVGKIGADSLPLKQNKVSGNGMLIAPILDQTALAKVRKPIPRMPVAGYKKYYYPDGEVPKQAKQPRTKVFRVYGMVGEIRSLTGSFTVLVSDTGKYTGFSLKCFKSSVEVYVNGKLRETLSPSDWKQFLYRGVVTLKVIGDAGGECYLDDWAKNGTGETFEVTNKIKVTGYVGSIKTGRFGGESASGLFSFKFTFVSSGSVNVE